MCSYKPRKSAECSFINTFIALCLFSDPGLRGLKIPTKDTTFRNSICFVADDSLDAVDVLGPNFVFEDLWLEPRFEK